MKSSCFYIFAFFAAVFLGSAALPVVAQEESEPAVEYKTEYRDVGPSEFVNDDKASITEHNANKLKDSTHVRGISSFPQKSKSADQLKPSSNKEEDALSFNFLYYIIQKFKISDLVDD